MARVPTPRRYAQAVFQMAEERGETDQWLDGLRAALVVAEEEALRTYLELPKVGIAERLRVIQEILVDVNPLVQSLIGLLVSRNSLGLYTRIVEEYERLLDAHYNRERATVTTAVSLDDQQQQRVREQLTKLLSKEVVLTTQVEPQVLGGLVARVGDRIIDGSTRGRLLGLRTSLVRSLG